ncbi:MAG TPA: hypothetical protein VN694_14795 [Caulobacteraceae bacterium]|nr:hypothetical protein [Caulobacteraceae bacterium]
MGALIGRTGTLALTICSALAAQAVAAATPTVLHISSHLPKTAKASLDGKPAVAAPGYGSTNTPAAAGHHTLKIVTATGAAYQAALELKPAQLMTWKGRGYWCVNLLEHSFEVYSAEDCQEEVSDAG